MSGCPACSKFSCLCSECTSYICVYIYTQTLWCPANHPHLLTKRAKEFKIDLSQLLSLSVSLGTRNIHVKDPSFPVMVSLYVLTTVKCIMRWNLRSRIQVLTKIMSPDFSCTHRQQLSQGWSISLLHLGLQGVSYSFCGVKSRAQILLFQNAFCLLNHISVGSWEPLTSLSSKFFPEESLYLDWLVHYHTKITSLLRMGRAWLKTKEIGPFWAGNHGNSAEWSHWNAAAYSDMRQERHNTKLQCDAAR